MRHIIKLSILSFLFLSIITNLYSQTYFQSASATENTVSASSNRKTGNDILDYSNVTYRVSVWDNGGTNPGLAWRVTSGGNTYAGNTTLAQTSNVFEPDVCLVVGGSDVFAIVVYCVEGGGGATDDYYWEYFKWLPASTTFSTQANSQFKSNGNLNTSVNIDANDQGDFVFIWDDAIDGIEINTGQIVTSVPNLNGSIELVGSGDWPDVCIYYDGSSTNEVYVTYIDGGGDLTVEKESFNTINGGSYNGSTELSVSPVYAFDSPRIAAPNRNGADDDWMVVAEDNNGSNANRIVGYNSDGGSVSSAIYYNNGSVYPQFSTAVVPNLRPAVTYDSQGSGTIWIGWTMDNTSNTYGNGADDAMYPIVVNADHSGAVGSGFTQYWEVPNTLGVNSVHDYLALSGRHSLNTAGNEKLFLSYYYNDTPRLTTKQIITSTATSLRLSDDHFNDFSFFSSEHFPEGMYVYKLVDITGRNILIEKGSVNEIRERLFSNIKNLLPSVYIGELTSADGKIYQTGKVCIRR